MINTKIKTNYEFYKEMETQLLWCRLECGVGSKEENPIVDIMCDIWYKLNDDEQDLLNKECPQCFPSKAFLEYKEMTKKLNIMQKENEEQEEELLLDKMDIVWHNMTDKEKDWMRRNHKNI